MTDLGRPAPAGEMPYEREKRLEEKVFESLAEMMAAYADEAMGAARAEHGVSLDLTEPSVPAIQKLEQILSAVAGDVDGGQTGQGTDVEFATKLWGAYFGELLRRRYNGAWEMSVYPGGTVSVPALEVKGSRLYPLMKVHRRLTLGAAESVAAFYYLIVATLGEPIRAGREPTGRGRDSTQ